MNVLVLVGSLRAGSTNQLLADAAIAHLPSGVEGTVFARLAELPTTPRTSTTTTTCPRSPATCVRPSPTRTPCCS